MPHLPIVCLAGCEWASSWQPTQAIMQRLAEFGHIVHYIQPLGLRTPRWQDVGRLCRRIRLRHTTNRPADLEVHSILTLPWPTSRQATAVNCRWVLRQVPQPAILWVSYASPLTAALATTGRWERVIYHHLSDVSAVYPHPAFQAAHQQLLRRAERILCNSHTLLDSLPSQVRSHARLLRPPNDYRLFATLSYIPDSLCDLLKIPPPRIVYSGSWHQWIDRDWFVTVARALPRMSFILLGPSPSEIPADLAALPNVYALGPHAHEDLPDLLAHCDLGVIPYRICRYTDSSYPAKLNEYLAVGFPIVAPSLGEFRSVNEEAERPLLSLVRSAEHASHVIRYLVPRKNRTMRIQRQNFARQSDWRHAWPIIEEAIACSSS